MDLLYKLNVSLIISLIICSSSLNAQDTVVVKTFTYDSIQTRRGIFPFPNNSDTYRRIIMKYSLKCDSRTMQDIYSCGEWDYLTYNVVYKPTGIMDSNLQNQRTYNWNYGDSPDTLKYRSNPTFNINQKYSVKTTLIDSSGTTANYIIGSDTKFISLNNVPTRIQFPIKKVDLKAIGVKSGQYNMMKFNFSGTGTTIKNFTLKLFLSNDTSAFFANNFETYFQGDLTISKDGWINIPLSMPFTYSSLLGMVVQISYDGLSNNNPVKIICSNGTSIAANDKAYCMNFEGDDYVDCGLVPQFDGLQKFTLEGWVYISNGVDWARFMEKGGKIGIELTAAGDVYCIMRNWTNSYAYAKNALPKQTWTHVALVFDGTQANENNRLRLLINGSSVALTVRGTPIPQWTPDLKSPFIVGENLNGKLFEIRAWKTDLTDSVIKVWMLKPIDSSHPSQKNLILYLPMNDTLNYLKDQSGLSQNVKPFGFPSYNKLSKDDMQFNVKLNNILPNMALFAGTYKIKNDTTIVADTVFARKYYIQKWAIVNNKPKQIDTIYACQPGWCWVYNPNSNKIDSLYLDFQTKISNSSNTYYSDPYEIKEAYEIGRFITPYGKMLDLGPNGFTWFYDVTDYASLLKGNVDFEVGNQQELPEVTFYMIKGTPPRNVKKITKLWQENNHGAFLDLNYASLSNDTRLSKLNVPISKDIKQSKIITRLTGHGHQSNNGQYPHCCEWKDNEHSLLFNGIKECTWHIWREFDCASNPVYPQGGTWPGSREGWCPGDIVPDFVFEVQKFIKNDTLNIDYDISKVPATNLGMGSGNYVVSMQLFEYDKANNDYDVELLDIITPNITPYYSRKNPICANPSVIIRNNSSANDLTKLSFKYSVAGSIEQTYDWNGLIKPNMTETISLPWADSQLWIGDSTRVFNCIVNLNDGNQDTYLTNNTAHSVYRIPDIYPNKFIINYLTNLRPFDYSFEIKDANGNIIYSPSNLATQTRITDTISLKDGCYTLEIFDPYNEGFSYWADPSQGSGALSFMGLDKKTIKAFNPDFGHLIYHCFTVGVKKYVEDSGLQYLANLYPNPADDKLTIALPLLETEIYEIMVNNLSGSVIHREMAFLGGNSIKEISTANLAVGAYFVILKSQNYEIRKQFVKR